jgi:hypothetical protein
MSWSQGGEGMAGSQEIAESDPPRRVVYALSFGPGTEAQATLRLPDPVTKNQQDTSATERVS